MPCHESGDLLVSVDYRPADLGFAYAVLAPLVAEAWSFMQCKEFDRAAAALQEAMGVIEAVGNTSYNFRATQDTDDKKNDPVIPLAEYLRNAKKT